MNDLHTLNLIHEKRKINNREINNNRNELREDTVGFGEVDKEKDINVSRQSGST